MVVVADDGCSGGPGEQLREMEHTEFMDLICAVYKSLLGCVQGIQMQNAIIGEVVESIRLGLPRSILYICSILMNALKITGLHNRPLTHPHYKGNYRMSSRQQRNCLTLERRKSSGTDRSNMQHWIWGASWASSTNRGVLSSSARLSVGG